MDTAMVMDTTIRAASNKKHLPKLGLIAIALASFMANGAEQRIDAVLNSELSFIDREYEDDESLNVWQYQIAPSITYVLDGNKADLAFNLSQQFVGADDSDLISSRSYTNYSGQLTTQPFDWLFFNASAARSYRASNPLDSAFGRSFINRDGLSRVSTVNLNTGLLLDSPIADGQFALTYASADSEQIEGTSSFLGADTETKSANLSLNSDESYRLIWSLSAGVNESKRERYADFESEQVSLSLSLPVWDRWYFRVNANHEDYDVEEGSLNFGNLNNLEQTSYGAGIEWRRSSEKYFAVTYNRAEREGLDRDDNFWAADLAWSFSERTNMKANYGKRFYGTSKSLQITHQNRHVTTSISHQEGVTAQSRLGLDTDLGIYSCPPGAGGLVDCARVDVDYQPLPGEFLVNTVEYTPEITEQVRFIRTSSANIAWQVGVKLSVGVGVSHNETEYLESDRASESDNITLFSDYQLGRKHKVNASLSYVDAEGNGFTRQGKSKSAAIGLNSQLGRKLSTAVNYRFTDRDSDSEFYSMKENRISFSATYKF